MKHVDSACIKQTDDSQIKFEENRKKIVFINTQRLRYKKVQVDGCAIKEGAKCDNLLVSEDEKEEYYVELKGKDIKHAIEQIERTIDKIGEHSEDRHSYIICSRVIPAITTFIQKKKIFFGKQYKSELVISRDSLNVRLS